MARRTPIASPAIPMPRPTVVYPQLPGGNPVRWDRSAHARTRCTKGTLQGIKRLERANDTKQTQRNIQVLVAGEPDRAGCRPSRSPEDRRAYCFGRLSLDRSGSCMPGGRFGGRPPPKPPGGSPGKPAGHFAWLGPRPFELLPFLPLRVFLDDLVALRRFIPGNPMPPSCAIILRAKPGEVARGVPRWLRRWPAAEPPARHAAARPVQAQPAEAVSPSIFG